MNDWWWLLALIIFFLSVVTYLIIFLRRLQRAVSELKADFTQRQQQVMKFCQEWGNTIDEATARAVLLGKQQIEFELQLKRLAQNIVDLQQQDPTVRLYHRATELAKQGATVEDIVQGCDISYAEAILLVNLHQKHLDV